MLPRFFVLNGTGEKNSGGGRGNFGLATGERGGRGENEAEDRTEGCASRVGTSLNEKCNVGTFLEGA